jgi:hypothetical protein
MKEVYVIYNLFRPVTNTWLRIAETYRHASDPNIFNRLVTELEKLEKGNEDGWIGSYQFVSKELFENFLENTHEIGSIS